MNIAPTASKIYQKAIKEGAQLLENGCAYKYRFSKHNPAMLIQQTIAPNGSYAAQISENGKITKVISKTVLQDGKAAAVDTWDFTKNKGVWLNTVEKETGSNILTRAHDKTSQTGFDPEGIIYQWIKDTKSRHHDFVSTMDQMSVSKMFTPAKNWAQNFKNFANERFPFLTDEFNRLYNRP